jgi:hypothetical protein
MILLAALGAVTLAVVALAHVVAFYGSLPPVPGATPPVVPADDHGEVWVQHADQHAHGGRS